MIGGAAAMSMRTFLRGDGAIILSEVLGRRGCHRIILKAAKSAADPPPRNMPQRSKIQFRE
jgi:hypothetical protein